MSIKLTAEARALLRNRITNHEGWTREFRTKHGYSLATMSRDDYEDAATKLGINIRAVMREAAEKTASTSDDIRADKAKEAAAKFSDETAFTEEKARNIRVQFNEAAQPMKEETIVLNAKQFDDTQAKPVPATDTASKLARMLAELAASSIDENRVQEIVRDEIEKALASYEFTGNVVTIELTENSLPVGKVDGHKHAMLPKLLRYATAKGVSGYSPNVWIAGPAGSGKTFAAAQVARALDIPFHSNGAISMPHELLGFIDAAGTYHRTAFREAYEHGGVYLFDEVDGSDNAAILALNAALANGFCTFPDGEIKRHKDCRIFAAANTFGHGATAEYVGRAKLDAAFLNRFPVKLSWSYDEELEVAMCGNAEFAKLVQKARKAAANCGLKVLITPRHSEAGAALIAAGATMQEAAEDTFLADLTADQKRMMQANMA